jgi:hypothetical protein
VTTERDALARLLDSITAWGCSEGDDLSWPPDVTMSLLAAKDALAAPPAPERAEIERLVAALAKHASERGSCPDRGMCLTPHVANEDAARASLLAAFDRALAAQDGLRERVAALERAAGAVEEPLRLMLHACQGPLADLVRRCHRDLPHNHDTLRVIRSSMERLTAAHGDLAAALRALSTPAAPKKETEHHE